MQASFKTNVIMELTDVIDFYMVLRTTLREYDEDVIKHGRAGSERDAFAMIYNNVHMTAEILNWYQYEWAKPVRSFSKEIDHERRQQNADRINELTKHLFIGALSAIEFSAKQKARMSNRKAFDKLKKIWEKGGRVYLSGIMQASLISGVIDEQTYA